MALPPPQMIIRRNIVKSLELQWVIMVLVPTPPFYTFHVKALFPGLPNQSVFGPMTSCFYQVEHFQQELERDMPQCRLVGQGTPLNKEEQGSHHSGK